MGSWYIGGGHRLCYCDFYCTHHCKPRTPAARPSAQARSPVRCGALPYPSAVPRQRASMPPRRWEGAPLPTCTSSTCGPPSMTSQQPGKSWVAGQCGPRVSNTGSAACGRACSGCWAALNFILPGRSARHAWRACISILQRPAALCTRAVRPAGRAGCFAISYAPARLHGTPAQWRAVGSGLCTY
jgi:hypothetical protein